MKKNSKGLILFTYIALIALSLLAVKTTHAAEKKEEKSKSIPVYPGSTFVKATSKKSGTLLKEYCSKDSARFIKNYYMRKYPQAIELSVGTKEGNLEKLLLDVKSPLQRFKSRQSVSLLPANKTGSCRTRIWIEDYPKKKEKKKVKKPAEVKEAKKETKAEQVTRAPEPKKIIKKAKPATTITEEGAPKNIMGIGASVNTVNSGGGASLMLWLHPSMGIQANYGTGEFTSYEAKLFYRMNIDYPLKPYFGGGYLHVEKDATILGEDITFEADSYTLFAGMEYKLNNNFSFYADIAGTPLKLEDEFIIGASKVIAEVDYTPVTVNLNMVYYFW